MKTSDKKKKPIFIQFSIILIVSVAIAFIFLFAMYAIIDTVNEKARVENLHIGEHMEAFEAYVKKHDVSSEDQDIMEKWDKDNPDVILQVKEGARVIYDGMEIEEEGTSFEGHSFDVAFSDKELSVTIMVNDEGVSDSSASYVLAIILSFFVFLIPVLAFMKKKIQYIEQLSSEVALLESGSLEYPVTVRGNDELSDLAHGIESMRVSFKQQIEETDELADENQKMVSRISHDLRTPLTAISLYADILENNDRLTLDQQKEYVGKITKKVQHMKDLSEHLLTYSKEQRIDKVVLEKRHTDKFFYVSLSDFCSYLMEQGFTIDSELEWDDTVIYVNEEAVERIFNNMSSNLLKYADRYRPMHIRGWYEDEYFFLEFRNFIAQEERYTTGSGIGLYSVEEMMMQMQGTSIITATDEEFAITLQFKKVIE